MLVSHWEREGSRDMIGGVKREEGEENALINRTCAPAHTKTSSVLLSLSPHTWIQCVISVLYIGLFPSFITC